MRLTWSPTEQQYETGVDHGVLYPITGPGVAWNGLVSVEESTEGGEVQSLYFDGIKYLEPVSNTDFQATLKAYSSPKAFASCLGQATVRPGVYLTHQPRLPFGLSYRTKIGDVDYKIHLVYNALASATARGHQTLRSTVTPTIFEWELSTVPVAATAAKPTSHFVLDSTKVSPASLAIIEAILYGTDVLAPRLPDITELQSVLA